MTEVMNAIVLEQFVARWKAGRFHIAYEFFLRIRFEFGPRPDQFSVFLRIRYEFGPRPDQDPIRCK